MQTSISERVGDYGKCTFNHTVENSLQKHRRHFKEDHNRKETWLLLFFFFFLVTKIAPRSGIMGDCFLYSFFFVV